MPGVGWSWLQLPRRRQRSGPPAPRGSADLPFRHDRCRFARSRTFGPGVPDLVPGGPGPGLCAPGPAPGPGPGARRSGLTGVDCPTTSGSAHRLGLHRLGLPRLGLPRCWRRETGPSGCRPNCSWHRSTTTPNRLFRRRHRCLRRRNCLHSRPQKRTCCLHCFDDAGCASRRQDSQKMETWAGWRSRRQWIRFGRRRQSSCPQCTAAQDPYPTTTA